MKWINVNEKTPRFEGNYLVLLGNGGVKIDFYGAWVCGDKERWDFLTRNVTHWTKLPKMQESINE